MKAYKHSIILLLLLLSCMSIPAAVTAIYFEHEYADIVSGTEEYSITFGGTPRVTAVNELFFLTNSKEYYSGLKYLSHQVQSVGFYQSYPEAATIYSGDNIPVLLYADSARTVLIGRALYSWDTNYNALGNPISTDTWVHFEEFDSRLISDSTIYFNTEDPLKFFRFSNIYIGNLDDIGSNPSLGNIYLKCQLSYAAGEYTTVYQGSLWENQISGTHTDDLISHLDLTRNGYRSNFTVWYGDHIYIQDNSVNNISRDIPSRYYTYKIVSSYGTEYTEIFEPVSDEPETVSVLGSVLSTADDALIGGATLNFNSTYQNVSQTLTNGYGLFTLYPDVEYTVSASADNYQEELSTNPTVTFHSDTPYDYYLKPVYGVENGTVQLNFYVSTANTVGSGYLKVPTAVISLNSEKTLITNSAGYAYTILNRSGSISYTITKSGYKTYSRSYTPNWETWSSDTFEEYIILLAEGATTGGVTPVPTPDTRSSNEKAESAMNILFDNIEGIVQLAVVVLIISLISMIAGGGKKR